MSGRETTATGDPKGQWSWKQGKELDATSTVKAPEQRDFARECEVRIEDDQDEWCCSAGMLGR